MPAKIELANPRDLIGRYLAGASVKQLSDETSVSRPALTRLLREHDVPLRGRSAAERVKWTRIKQSPEKVRRQCARAWEAARERDKYAAIRPRVIEMYTSGLGSVIVARELGIPRQAVKDMVGAEGLTRNKSEAALLRCARMKVAIVASDNQIVQVAAVTVEVGSQDLRPSRSILRELRERLLGTSRGLWRAAAQKLITFRNLFRR